MTQIPDGYYDRAVRKRRSARIILMNELKQVLLIRFAVERENQPFTFWATPGGGVEHNETDLEAARRELMEELGLDIEFFGPVHSHTSDFEHEGEMISNSDVFFVGKSALSIPELKFVTEAERAAMKEIRWWSLTEIERAVEVIFPNDFGRILRTINLSARKEPPVGV